MRLLRLAVLELTEGVVHPKPRTVPTPEPSIVPANTILELPELKPFDSNLLAETARAMAESESGSESAESDPVITDGAMILGGFRALRV